MGDESHAGDSLAARSGGEPAIDIAKLVYMGVLEPQLIQLRRQLRPQQFLLGRGGDGVGAGVGLGVKGDILQKAV